MSFMEENHGTDSALTDDKKEMSDTQNEIKENENVEKKDASEIKSHGQNLKSKLIWMLVFVLIAALTISTLVAQGGLTLSGFVTFITSLDLPYLLGAIGLMLAYIVLEGLAILTIIKSFGYKRNLLKGLSYASGDIYFSAITPSATGGQPASAFFMMKDKIPGAVVTVSLVVNLIMYTFAIIAIAIVAVILDPAVILGFSVTSKVFIAIGAIMLISVGILFLLVLFKGNILRKISNAVITFLAKIKIVRKPEKRRQKLEEFITSYKGYVAQIGGKRWMLVRAFIFNFLQRASLIMITVLTYLATGNDPSLAVDVAVTQCLVVLGSNPMPIPGAMGISDFLLIDGFGAIGLSDMAATNLNLLSRTISFYSCVVLCGLVIVVRMISYRVSASREERLTRKNDNSTL